MKSLILREDSIKDSIFVIRGVQVMLDSDLAEIYGVPVKRLNEQVRRNIERFPEKFMFQITNTEKNELVANCDRFKKLKHSSSNPYAFTEQGVAMLSGVLKSHIAVKISIKIIEAFISMRQFISKNTEIFYRLDSVERKQLDFEIKTDKNFERVFDALQTEKPKQGIFFDGQIFDSYKFVSDIIRSASKSIVLIDNYIDDSVLTLFCKRSKNVNVTIFTKEISKQLLLDLAKYNSQYPHIEVKEFDRSHDRFLIIDDKEVYHFGASLKDLGKKWFGFSKFDKEALNLLNKL